MSVPCSNNNVGAYHTDLAKNVARCRDSEVRIQRALKLANVDLGCLNVMASPSLFLHFFRQLVFPCSYLIRGTITTSLLVLVENIFTPFIYKNRAMPQKINMLSLIIVALSIRKVDLRVDEVQGVINQVDLSGRSMKG